MVVIVVVVVVHGVALPGQPLTDTAVVVVVIDMLGCAAGDDVGFWQLYDLPNEQLREALDC
jgi:hypothetical protein